MRGLLRALPVCLVALAGCFTTGSESSHIGGAPPTYWQQANAILSRKAASDDLRSNLALVRQQADALRELPSEGADPAVVAAVEEVVRCEDEVSRIALLANDDPAVFKQSQLLAAQFSDANRKAADAKKRLKAFGPRTPRGR
jgi:hypothetical protein